MEESIFQTALDFAVIKEYEAELFYRQLAERKNLRKYSNVFFEIARKEILHAKDLEKIRCQRVTVILPSKEIEKLLVENQISKNPDDFITFKEAILYCIEEEEMSMKLYEMIALYTNEGQLKKLFLKIYEEEKEHKKILVDQFSNLATDY